MPAIDTSPATKDFPATDASPTVDGSSSAASFNAYIIIIVFKKKYNEKKKKSCQCFFYKIKYKDMEHYVLRLQLLIL